MKKLALLICLLPLLATAQTTEQKIRAKKAEFVTITEQIEKLKMEQDFKPVNIDTLDVKKSVIVFAKDNDQTFVYIKVGNNNYRMQDISINMTFNGEIYNLKQSGDSLVCYGDKGVVLFTIK